MKRRKEKKSLKSSFMILLLLAVFLIISTYAWFTTNKLVRINPIDVNIEASIGFQISADAKNWKTVLNINDFITGGEWTTHKNHVGGGLTTNPYRDLEFTFDPVSTATLTNATTGFMDMFLGEVDTDETGTFMLKTTQISEGPTSPGSFIAFDLFFRANAPIELHLAKEAAVVDNADPVLEPSFYGKGMENAARIAFVYQGMIKEEEYGTYAGNVNNLAAAARDLVYSTYAATTGAYNPYSAIGNPTEYTDGRNVTVWEPNYISHTEATKIDMDNIFIGNSFNYNNRQIIHGVKAETTTANIAATTGNSVKLINNNATAEPGVFQIADNRVIPTIKNNSVPRDGSTAPQVSGRTVEEYLKIDLQPGITKFRVYLWLEGQDWDCYDTASGSKILWNLILTSVGPGSGAADPMTAVTAAKALIPSSFTVPNTTNNTPGDIATAAETYINGLTGFAATGVSVSVVHDTANDFIVTLSKSTATDTLTVSITIAP